MTFITRDHLHRRTLLKGLGVSMALPLLDAMIPALTAQSKTAANPIKRLGFVYVPHGAIMERFTPATEGSNFEFSPILRPLEPFRDRVVVVSGLAHKTADNAGVHSMSPTTWLSGLRPNDEESSVRAGVTVDQMAAQRIGHGPHFPSLERATEDHSRLI